MSYMVVTITTQPGKVHLCLTQELSNFVFSPRLSVFDTFSYYCDGP